MLALPDFSYPSVSPGSAMSDISPDETVRAALQISHRRLQHQHELFVDFGVKSLKSTDIDVLLQQACHVVSAGMQTRFAKVLKQLPGEDTLLLYKGVGWDECDIGHATVGGDDASPAGYAFSIGRPVISNHLGQEHRFRTPSLLKKYGIERAINVPIRAAAGFYGVLEADSTEAEHFIESDLVFMEGIANIISITVERLATNLESTDDSLYSQSILNSSPDCVKILTVDGVVEFFNESGLCQMQIDSLDNVRGKRWIDLWPTESKGLVQDAITKLSRGDSVRFESYCPTSKGEPRWWDVTAAPIMGKTGVVENLIAISRDITSRHVNEATLTSLIETQNSMLSESGLHVEEIHHRVKNSLHLVNTLLLLQSNMAVEEAVKTQLQTAASRVMTIAKVHERLYYDVGLTSVDVAGYLQSLIADIQGTFEGRPLTLVADSFAILPERMAPLGLIISELITNSLKYGKGAITVTFRNTPPHALITVTDEGDGFPDTYPKPSGTGLGMRLVKSYSGFGADGVRVDRDAPLSTIRVKFKL